MRTKKINNKEKHTFNYNRVNGQRSRKMQFNTMQSVALFAQEKHLKHTANRISEQLRGGFKR